MPQNAAPSTQQPCQARQQLCICPMLPAVAQGDLRIRCASTHAAGVLHGQAFCMGACTLEVSQMQHDK